MSRKLAAAAGFIMFSSLAVADNTIVTDSTSSSNHTPNRVVKTTHTSLLILATLLSPSSGGSL